VSELNDKSFTGTRRVGGVNAPVGSRDPVCSIQLIMTSQSYCDNFIIGHRKNAVGTRGMMNKKKVSTTISVNHSNVCKHTA